MAKNKFYAVKKGNKTGVFSTWEECQDATRGYPNAEFKSFITFEEAQAYLDDVDIIMQNDIIPRLKENRVLLLQMVVMKIQKNTMVQECIYFCQMGKQKKLV